MIFWTAWAQVSAAPYIVYGKDTSIEEGDTTNFQVFYFSLPETFINQLYFRVFDPDIGDDYDISSGKLDSATRFTLYGGNIGFKQNYSLAELSSIEVQSSGEIIVQQDFSTSADTNGRWLTLGKLDPQSGQLLDGRRYFKIIVQGLTGNDGNVYDYFISTSSFSNFTPKGIENFAYLITSHLSQKNSLAQLNVPIGEAKTLKINSFDVKDFSSTFQYASATRLLELNDSATDWTVNEINIEPEESTTSVAISYGTKDSIANDASFYFQDQQDNLLKLNLPIEIVQLSLIPNFIPSIKYLSDCTSAVFSIENIDNEPNLAEYEYRWKIGNEPIKIGNTIVHNFQKNGNYKVRLDVLSPYNNYKHVIYGEELEANVGIRPEAVFNLSDIVSEATEIEFDASNSKLGKSGQLTYEWKFSDGFTSTKSKFTRKFTKTGNYSVSLSVKGNEDNQCNFSSLRKRFKVNQQPIAKIGNSDKKIDIFAQTLVVLTAIESVDYDGNIESYEWFLEDGTSYEGLTFKHKFSEAGTYKIILKVRDDSGVENGVAFDEIEISVKPMQSAKAIVSKTEAAVGEDLNFRASMVHDIESELIYNWDFGDGNKAEGKEVRYAFSKPGSYSVTLSLSDPADQYRFEDFKFKININASPVAVIEYTKLDLNKIQFSAANSYDPDGFLTEFIWDFGDGVQSFQPNPSHVFREPGSYIVKLFVKDSTNNIRNFDVKIAHIDVQSLPIADSGSDQIKAVGQTVFFDGINSLDPDGVEATYEWEMGDGVVKKGQKVSHTYDKPGQYTVTLKFSDNAKADSKFDYDTSIVTINHPPVALIEGPTTKITPADEVELTGIGSYDPDGEITEYEWKFDDLNQSIFGEGVVRRFSQAGTYEVILYVTDDSGSLTSTSQDIMTIQVNSQPMASPKIEKITDEQTVILSGTDSFDADNDQLIYEWNLGDGSKPKYGAKIYHNYKSGGVYPVSLTVDDKQGLANSKSTAYVSVGINQPPVAIAGADKEACTNDILLFDGTKSYDPDGDLLKYLWIFGDGIDGKGVTTTHSFSKPGIYKTLLKITDNSEFNPKSHRDSLLVNVSEAPNAEAGDDIETCVFQVLKFDGSNSTDVDGEVNNYTWNFGDGTTASGEFVTHSFKKPGSYRVNLIIEGETNSQCDGSDEDSLMVYVNDGVKANFEIKGNYFVNQPITFNGSTSISMSQNKINSWTWDFGNPLSSDNVAQGEEVIYSYSRPGEYLVSLRVSNGTALCGDAVVSRKITINKSPVAIVGKSMTIGAGALTLFDGSLSYDNAGSVKEYEWDFGDGDTRKGIEVYKKYEKPGNYKVKLKVYDDSNFSNNYDEAVIDVAVNSAPNAIIEASSQNVCVGEEITFSGENSSDSDGNIISYRWDFGDGTTSNKTKLNHTFNNPGTYQVTLLVQDDSGTSNATNIVTKQVKVNQPPTIVQDAPSLACPDETIRFDASNSTDPDGKIIGYQWDFGNGKVFDSAVVSTKFDKPGTYNVNLKIQDDSNLSCSVVSSSFQLTVNEQPIANAGQDKEVTIGSYLDRVLFDGSGSVEKNSPLTYLWDFGDGNFRMGTKVFYLYNSPGDYKVKLTVSDNSGLICGEDTDEITVRAIKQ